MFTFTRIVVGTIILSAVGLFAVISLILLDEENPLGVFMKRSYEIRQQGEDFAVRYCVTSLALAIYDLRARKGTYVGIESDPDFQQIFNRPFNTGRSCAEIKTFIIGASEKDYCISAVLPRSQIPVCRDERMRQAEKLENARPSAEYTSNEARPNKVCGGNTQPYCQ